MMRVKELGDEDGDGSWLPRPGTRCGGGGAGRGGVEARMRSDGAGLGPLCVAPSPGVANNVPALFGEGTDAVWGVKFLLHAHQGY